MNYSVGQVITFYSYKGGVGRSMSMANIAVLLAKWGKKVLIIDWDLEAPGLEYFFYDRKREIAEIEEIRKKKGVIDLLLGKAHDTGFDIDKIDWDEYETDLTSKIHANGVLRIITSGLKDEDYVSKVRKFNYTEFYDTGDGGQFIEELRTYWILNNYDYVFVDSRTGLTESGGVCTIQLPDILVLLFTPNEQSLRGVMEVADRSFIKHEAMAYERHGLRQLFIPTRFDDLDPASMEEWLRIIETLLSPHITWLPYSQTTKECLFPVDKLLEQIKIPYKVKYAYGEKLAVLSEGTRDPQGLGYVMETIAAILVNEFAMVELLADSRDLYIKKAKGEDDTQESSSKIKIEKEQLAEQVEKEQKAKRELETKIEAKNKQSRIRGIISIGVFVLLVLLIASSVVFNFPLNFSKTIVKPELSDSLIQKESYLNFIKTYNTATNQYDADFNLKLILQYYQLPAMYRDSAAYIKENSEDVIGYKFTTIVKDYYSSLSGENKRPVEFFNDTLSLFGNLSNIPARIVQQKIDSIRNHDKLLNRIADTTSMTTESDSAGFNIKFIEKGNFLIDKTEEYNDLECAVSMRVGYDFKIHAMTYTQLKGKFISKAGQKTVLEIFICQSNDKQHRQNILSITNMLEKTNQYRIYTRNNFRIPSDPASPFYIKSNEIRYNGAEEQNIAATIRKLIGEKIKVDLRPARTATPNYLSIFLCFDQNNISVPITDPKQYKNLP